MRERVKRVSVRERGKREDERERSEGERGMEIN